MSREWAPGWGCLGPGGQKASVVSTQPPRSGSGVSLRSLWTSDSCYDVQTLQTPGEGAWTLGAHGCPQKVWVGQP